MSEYLSSGLDYYKATMSQLEFATHPDAWVGFDLKNRGDMLLSDYIEYDELQKRLDSFKSGFKPEEIAYLASLQNQDGTAQFSEEYLDFLADSELPRTFVGYEPNGDISVYADGKWPLVTFWETVVMSEINELYFENKCRSEGTSLAFLYEEGNRRLDEKIARLKERPDIKISDFGTRRRFSYDWQKHVVERLATELPDNFVGTSNIYLAHTLGLKPIGTFAHELPMVYATLAHGDGHSPLDGHNQVLQDWEQLYKGDLSTALTDTFTTDFFFSDFTPEQAHTWKALRHDSGDPIEFGEKVIEDRKSVV